MKNLYFNRKRVLTRPRGTGAYGYFGFGWRDIVTLIAYFIGQVILSVLFILAYVVFNPFLLNDPMQLSAGISSNQVVAFGPYIPILIFFLFLFWRELKQDMINFWKNKWRILGISLLIWIAGYIILLIYGFVIEQIIGGGSGLSANQEILNQVMAQNGIFFLIFVAIIVPFIEEIVFRKVLFTHFGNSVNYIISGIISVLVFALLHVTSELILGQWLSFATVFPVYLMIAVIVTLSNYLNKNFIAGVFIHMFHNAVVVLLMIFFS